MATGAVKGAVIGGVVGAVGMTAARAAGWQGLSSKELLENTEVNLLVGGAVGGLVAGCPQSEPRGESLGEHQKEFHNTSSNPWKGALAVVAIGGVLGVAVGAAASVLNRVAES